MLLKGPTLKVAGRVSLAAWAELVQPAAPVPAPE
jgi:hypothetical protein